MLCHEDIRYLKKHHSYVVGRGSVAYCALCNMKLQKGDKPCQSRDHSTLELYQPHVLYLVSKGLQPQLSNSRKSLTVHLPSGWRYIRLAELETKSPQDVYVNLINSKK